jgi:hypothetical protein
MRTRALATVAAILGAAFITATGTASAAPPVGSCPPGFTLQTVAFVVHGAGLTEPDPSMDPNGNGYTCLKLINAGANGAIRASWHDDVSSVPTGVPPAP